MLIRLSLILALGLSIFSSGYAETNTAQEKILIFVSFSMPKESIKNWISEAQSLHAPVILRGFVNNSFKETVTAIANLIQDKKAHGGLQIDPILFKLYHITEVPAVIRVHDDTYDVLYGNVSLDYALKKLREESHA